MHTLETAARVGRAGRTAVGSYSTKLDSVWSGWAGRSTISSRPYAYTHALAARLGLFGKRENGDVVVHVDEWEYPAVVRSNSDAGKSAPVLTPRRFGVDSEMSICEDASNVVVGVLVLRYR